MRILVTGRDNPNEWTIHDEKGRFKRSHQEWSLERFNDGFLGKDGRFMVYVPNHPRASQSGYVYREIVAYEAYHNTQVQMNHEVHHIDGSKSKDTKENLELLTHSEHRLIHSRMNRTRRSLICVGCSSSFELPMYRIRQGRGKYCSQTCYRNRDN